MVIEKSLGAPRIAKDGVSVAKEIELADKFENTGAQLLRGVASKINDAAGNGTTTAIVLAQAIVREGAKVKERKDRLDDALNAKRAAVEEGIVPGGGVVLARASLALAKLKVDNEDQRVGVEIIRRAIQTPCARLPRKPARTGRHRRQGARPRRLRLGL